MKKNMVGNVPGNVLGMYADLSHKLKKGAITQQELALFLKRQNPFCQLNKYIYDWQNFYEGLRVKVDFSKLKIPKKQVVGFDRLIIVPKGMTPQAAYKLCEGLFPCWKWTGESLDDIIKIEDRTAKKRAYAVWVRDRVEADEELKSKSADAVKLENILTITLTERLMLGAKYFVETGKHMDIVNTTLCFGSRSCDGDVPAVNRDYDGVDVCRYNPDSAGPDLRARQIVC